MDNEIVSQFIIMSIPIAVENIMYAVVRIIVVAAGLAIFSPQLAMADDQSRVPTNEELRAMEPEQRRQVMEGLSAEERAALKARIEEARQERRAAYEAMSPEEKEAFRKERRERFDALPEDEKKAIKERQKKKAQKRLKAKKNSTEAKPEQ